MFPGIRKSPVELMVPNLESSSNQPQYPATVSKVSETEIPSQAPQSSVTESKFATPLPTTPSIIPGFSLSSGFKKLSAFSLPSTANPSNTTNHETASPSTFPKNTAENIQMPVISNISTGISTFDLDDLISSPPQLTSADIDMESLLNEKLLDEEKRKSFDNGDTDDFLKEIDEQLADTN